MWGNLVTGCHLMVFFKVKLKRWWLVWYKKVANDVIWYVPLLVRLVLDSIFESILKLF